MRPKVLVPSLVLVLVCGAACYWYGTHVPGRPLAEIDLVDAAERELSARVPVPTNLSHYDAAHRLRPEWKDVNDRIARLRKHGRCDTKTVKGAP